MPEVDVPALLLYAGHDVRAPVAVGEATHAAVRDSELVVLSGPGHVSPVEAADDVTRELRRFLRSVDAPDERPFTPSGLGTPTYACNSPDPVE